MINILKNIFLLFLSVTIPLLCYADGEKELRGMDNEPNELDPNIYKNDNNYNPPRALFVEGLKLDIRIIGSEPVVTFSPYLGKIFVSKEYGNSYYETIKDTEKKKKLLSTIRHEQAHAAFMKKYPLYTLYRAPRLKAFVEQYNVTPEVEKNLQKILVELNIINEGLATKAQDEWRQYDRYLSGLKVEQGLREGITYTQALRYARIHSGRLDDIYNELSTLVAHIMKARKPFEYEERNMALSKFLKDNDLTENAFQVISKEDCLSLPNIEVNPTLSPSDQSVLDKIAMKLSRISLVDMFDYRRDNSAFSNGVEQFVAMINKKKNWEIACEINALSELQKKEFLAFYIDKAWNALIKSDTDIQGVFSKRQQEEMRRSLQVCLFGTDSLGTLSEENEQNAANIMVLEKVVDKNKKDLWLLSINYGFFGDGIRTHNERVAKFAHELFGHGIVLRYLSDVQYLDLLDKKLRLRVASNAPVNINTVTDRRKDEKAIALLLKEEIDKGDFHLTEEEERMRLLILEAIAVSVENAVVNALDNNGKREKTIDFVRRMYSGNNLPFYEEAVKWSINNCNVDGLGGVYWFQLVDRVRVFGKKWLNNSIYYNSCRWYLPRRWLSYTVLPLQDFLDIRAVNVMKK